MKRLSLLLLLPLASGALFAQVTITGTVPPTGTVGVSYSASLALSPGTFVAAWSISAGVLPPGLTLSTPTPTSATATISGTPTTAGSYSFTVKATGTSANAPLVATQAYTVVIAAAAPPPVYITPSSLPNGTVGTAYQQVLTASGGYGAGTYTFLWDQTSAGSLPPGLGISTSGTISGTPSSVGIFIFAVKVTSQTPGAAAVSVSQGYTITITAPPLAIATTSLPAGTVGVPYSQTLAATGGTPPYTWRLTGSTLSVGLTLATSGTFSGTPTSPGSFTYQVTVTDSAQASASGSFTIKINPAALTITTASLPAGTVGTAYTATTLAATGGTPPYTWSVAAGALPGGLSISSAGVISGTPTAAGSFSFALQVTDSAQMIATRSYNITVAAGLTIVTATLPNGTVGTPYSQTLAAAGGSGTLTWSVATGALPTGITLSATGSLTGTPTATGTFSFTIQVVDAAKATATQALTIKINPAPLAITTSSLPGGTVGVSYTATTLAATGGTPPYTWSVASGALPSGLSISSAGVISGTPTAAGTFSVTLKVTDSTQVTTTQSFTITVTAALTITTATLPNGTVGAAYSQTLALAGGSGTFTWSVSTGALPGGVTLNSSTGSLSGTPTAPGAFTFTVNVAGGGQTATQSLTITVGVPPGPSVTITGLPATASPATQPALGITIPSAYPLAITGQITLTFAPDAPSPDDGQEVVFTTGGRTASFTVAASSTQVAFSSSTAPAVQVGTVSGTITLTLKLTAAGIDITPSPAPSTKIAIAKSAPFIKSATVTRTSSGFNLVVVGYATSREMVSATVGFTAAAGVTLASSSATVSLASVFAPFYQTADPPYGSQFSLTMPFTFTNGSNPLTSVSVQLTNAQGSSTTANATY